MPRTFESSTSAEPPHPRPRLKAGTFRSMGTVVSLTMPVDASAGGASAEDEPPRATAVVERIFGELDQTFSLYRTDSEASRLARGELSLRDASAGMRRRYEDALEWRLRTEGAFTPERPDGALDLSGLIKAYAIHEAGASLLALGRPDWCLNAGGDVLVSGSPAPGTAEPWEAGIVDPADRGVLLAGYPLGGRRRHAALATSGSAERGDHIWSGTSKKKAFVQVSVAAADIETADVLATAIVAGGLPMLDRATAHLDIAVLAVGPDGALLGTPDFRGQ